MRELTARLVYWKLAITKCVGKALNALLISIMATLNGVEWSSFTGTQKFIAVACALGAMWSVIDAFLNDTMAGLKKGNKDDTAFFYKPDIALENGTPTEPGKV